MYVIMAHIVENKKEIKTKMTLFFCAQIYCDAISKFDSILTDIFKAITILVNTRNL